MLNTENTEINGLEVTCQQLPARRATSLAIRLLKMIGPALPMLIEGGKRPTAPDGPVLQLLFANLDEKAAVDLIEQVLSSVTVCDTRADRPMNISFATKRELIDQVFTGRLRDLFAVIAFAVKVQFGDFFAGSSSEAGPSATPESRATPTP
jgi:hypothetical protein